MRDGVRLRGNPKVKEGPWSVGNIPNGVVLEIGRRLVYRLAVGEDDVSGDDFGTIFAKAAGGYHRASSLGLGDVVLADTVWSAKTVKSGNPHGQSAVRLVSGRTSPDYSAGISDPRADLAKTGDAVLSIWNARINELRDQHSDMRLVVLLRNMSTLEFCMFEQPITVFPQADYSWELNMRRNLEGRDKVSGAHVFTWQPHGSQFTIIRPVPGSARRFAIRKCPEQIGFQQVLDGIGFEDSWIAIERQPAGATWT